jgi:two-component system, OmpR family, sensor histidine kinase ChvG
MIPSMLSKPFMVSATAIERRDGGFGRAHAANPEVSGTAAKRRVSSLSRRIIFFNAAALIFLMSGVLLVQSTRVGLIDERMAGIKQEALIVASTLAEYATDDRTRAINDKNAEPLLRQLIAPTTLRARLYDTNGNLIIDTRNLLARNVVQTVELPALGFWNEVKTAVERFYDGVLGVRPFAKLGPYFEAGNNGRVYKEVDLALGGDAAGTERIDQQNKLVLSVAAPVERFRTVYGVLLLSTEGGDIDDILREERASLIGISVVAFLVMLFSSLYLSGTIAQPIRQLAGAADRVRHGRSGRETIPSMSDRDDEIGDLADSLSAMTKALYDRIDAIERFAADVAHELKNPLTSLKNAAEMLARSSDDTAARERLMAIMRNDIKRIDRLITDISDASRLDAELSRESSEPVDLSKLLETIVEIYRMMELPGGVVIRLTREASEHTVVMGRDERLGQIFRNLIDNAVSFSPAGGAIAIVVSRTEGRVRIAVADEGPGIPPDDLEAIFNRFYTQRPSEHEFGKNSGLGLSIARQIVEGAAGRIWAENRVDRSGARFVVELPLARSS